MTTEQYSDGYSEGYQEGWNAATDANPPAPLPVQEPVAWAVYDKRGGSKSLHWPENHSPNGDATMFDAVPLVPQPRPWVGLTVDEIELAIDRVDMNSLDWIKELHKFARAIEQALKERNHG